MPGPFSEGGANKALCKKNNGLAKDTFPTFPLGVMGIFGPNTMASTVNPFAQGKMPL